MNDDWLFDQPPSCAVVSLRNIVFNGAPILHVTHNAEDHGWQFLTLGDAHEEDAAVIGLGEIVQLDPSLLEVADIPPGWHAWRESVDHQWIREPLSTATEDIASIDYLAWFTRILGWDAALPFLVSTGSVLIAKTLRNQPPADILALVGLPVLAFTVRLLIGVHQIGSNGCSRVLRVLQRGALILALFVLAFVDFFVALIAFVPKGNAPGAGEMAPVYAVSLLTYVTLVTFAMYPGRSRRSGRL